MQLGLTLRDLDLEKQKAFIQCTFSRADAWLDWQENFKHDKPSYSFSHVFYTSLKGFKNLIFHAPNELRPVISFVSRVLYFVASLLPKKPTKVLKTS